MCICPPIFRKNETRLSLKPSPNLPSILIRLPSTLCPQPSALCPLPSALPKSSLHPLPFVLCPLISAFNPLSSTLWPFKIFPLPSPQPSPERPSSSSTKKKPDVHRPSPLALGIIDAALKKRKMRLLDLFVAVDKDKSWTLSREELREAFNRVSPEI